MTLPVASCNKQLKEGRVFGFSGLVVLHHCRKGLALGVWHGWSRDDYSQEAERDEPWCPAHFLSVAQSRMPAHWTVPPTPSIKPLWKCIHRHAQWCVSWVILNPDKLRLTIT